MLLAALIRQVIGQACQPSYLFARDEQVERVCDDPARDRRHVGERGLPTCPIRPRVLDRVEELKLTAGQQDEKRNAIIRPARGDVDPAVMFDRGDVGDAPEPGVQIVGDMIRAGQRAVGCDVKHRERTVHALRRCEHEVALPEDFDHLHVGRVHDADAVLRPCGIRKNWGARRRHETGDTVLTSVPGNDDLRAADRGRRNRRDMRKVDVLVVGQHGHARQRPGPATNGETECARGIGKGHAVDPDRKIGDAPQICSQAGIG